jgi:hypothetical protein
LGGGQAGAGAAPGEKVLKYLSKILMTDIEICQRDMLYGFLLASAMNWPSTSAWLKLRGLLDED